MLTILDSSLFRGEHRLMFTMDIKSLYTVIPNDEGLRALKYFLRMAEVVLTLNSFAFNGEHYKQIGGVAMGSKLGPNYACLFVGYVEEQMLRSYTGVKPDLYKRYMNDVTGAASCTKDDLTKFLTFVSSYHHRAKSQIFGPEFARIRIGARHVQLRRKSMIAIKFQRRFLRYALNHKLEFKFRRKVSLFARNHKNLESNFLLFISNCNTHYTFYTLYNLQIIFYKKKGMPKDTRKDSEFLSPQRTLQRVQNFLAPQKH